MYRRAVTLTRVTSVLPVRRATFSSEDPWLVPAGCASARLLRATDGLAPHLATNIAPYFDERFLTVVFSMTDDAMVATYYEHDAPLYEEDVVELFLAPERLEEYFEIEVSPVGTVFDARIASPDGVRATMRVDRDWNCIGIYTAARRVTERDGMTSVDIVVRIPFAALERETPRGGETWRANFFRIDRSPGRDEFSAWQPTMKTPADFHVTAVFGTLRFE
jgi:hypothetical protein